MPEAPLRVVIDTNVWISALISPVGPPGEVVRAFEQGRFVPVFAEALLQEIQGVLSRPRILRRRQHVVGEASALLVLIEGQGIRASPTGAVRACRDPSDDFLIETALLGEAQLIVTRDDDLKRDLALIDQLRQWGIEILSVAQFLERLQANSANFEG